MTAQKQRCSKCKWFDVPADKLKNINRGKNAYTMYPCIAPMPEMPAFPEWRTKRWNLREVRPHENLTCGSYGESCLAFSSRLVKAA